MGIPKNEIIYTRNGFLLIRFSKIKEQKEKEEKNNIKIDHIRFLFVILLDDPMVNREWKMQHFFDFVVHFLFTKKIISLGYWIWIYEIFFVCILLFSIPMCVIHEWNEIKMCEKTFFFFFVSLFLQIVLAWLLNRCNAFNCRGKFFNYWFVVEFGTEFIGISDWWRFNLHEHFNFQFDHSTTDQSVNIICRTSSKKTRSFLSLDSRNH